jgi:hypothetical protein
VLTRPANRKDNAIEDTNNSEYFHQYLTILLPLHPQVLHLACRNLSASVSPPHKVTISEIYEDQSKTEVMPLIDGVVEELSDLQLLDESAKKLQARSRIKLSSIPGTASQPTLTVKCALGEYLDPDHLYFLITADEAEEDGDLETAAERRDITYPNCRCDRQGNGDLYLYL